ncbi:MAG: RnfABCDGE type electron transport complex subunit E [Bacteroidota bacterium]
MNKWSIFAKGFIKDNPVFVLFLGLCPTLAVTTSAYNGLGMGLATTFVLLMSNLVVSIIKKLIPGKVRIPTFIVVIASFVTMVEMLTEAFVPDLYEQLGIFIPLIVVNCLVLGRSEAFASKNDIFSSVLDGLGMGLGFAFALTVLGGVREILGSGTFTLIPDFIEFTLYQGDGMLVFVLAPGAFLALGYLIMLADKLKKKMY